MDVYFSGMGIECYTCNSQKHKACDTFSSMSKEARIPYITKCWQLDDSDVKNYTMCRKIVQDGEYFSSYRYHCTIRHREFGCNRIYEH